MAGTGTYGAAWAGIAAALALFFLAVPAGAHHARPEYDQTEQSSITGTVKDFRLVNPHAWIELAVDTEEGSADWSFEGDSVPRLTRAGWNSDLMKPGDSVTILFSPRRDGRPGGIFRGVTTADGRFFSASRGRINLRFGPSRP